MPFATQLKIILYQLDTRWYISKNNHYLIITAGTGTESLPASLLVVSMGKAFKRHASIFMWQTGGGAKQSTRRGGPV